MGFIIRVIIILGFIGYVAEGKYKDVPDPPKKKYFKNSDEFINKIHKEGLIGYTDYKKNKRIKENKELLENKTIEEKTDDPETLQ